MTWVRVKVPVGPDHPVSVHQAMQLGGWSSSVARGLAKRNAPSVGSRVNNRQVGSCSFRHQKQANVDKTSCKEVLWVVATRRQLRTHDKAMVTPPTFEAELATKQLKLSAFSHPKRSSAMESHEEPWNAWMQWTPCYFWSFTKPFLVLPRLDTFIQLVAAWIHRFCWLLLGGESGQDKTFTHWKMCSCRIMSCSCQAIGLLTLAVPRGLACDVYIKVTHTSHTCQHVHGIRGCHWFPIWTYPEKCRRQRHLHFPAVCPHSVAQDTEANDPSHHEALCNHWSTTILSAIRKVLALPQCATRITISAAIGHMDPYGPYWALLLI